MEKAAIYFHLLAYVEALAREQERLAGQQDDASNDQFDANQAIIDKAIPLLYALADMPMLTMQVQSFLETL